MPVNGFSNEHDYEVQAYRIARKKYLAAERDRKQQEKAQKHAIKHAHRRHLHMAQRGDVSVLKSLKCLVLGRISSQVAQEPRLLQGLEVEISESDTDEISLRRALDWS